MTNQEWIDMFRVIPEEDQNSLVIVLQNGCEVNVDTVVSFEPNFLVMRGRVGGQVEDGRGFFVPFDQMLYFRIERLTNIAELRELMGAVRSPKAAAEPAAPAEAAPAAVPAPGSIVPPVAAVTDATANRNALLNRIRAARATQVAANRLMTQ